MISGNIELSIDVELSNGSYIATLNFGPHAVATEWFLDNKVDDPLATAKVFFANRLRHILAEDDKY